MAVRLGPLSPDELAIILGNPNPPTPGYVETGPISPARMAELLDGIIIDLEDLKIKVAALETDVATLQGDVTTLQAQIVTIQAQIVTLIADVTALQAQVATLIANVLTLQGDVTTLQAQMVAVQAQVVTLNVNVTTLQAQIVIVQAQIITLQITVAGLVLQTFGHVISSERVLTGFNLSGLTFGNDHLFYVDDLTRTVYEINKDTMALINSFATLGLNPSGLAYEDANSIWYGDRVSHLVREVNPTTGALVSSFNAGFDVSAIAFDGTHLWIGCEDDRFIRMFTTAGVLVRTITAFADVRAYGLTYVAPYLYVMGIYVEGVLIEMETSAAPLTPIIKYHAMKGKANYMGLAYDGSHLRLGQGGDLTTNSFISRVFRA